MGDSLAHAPPNRDAARTGQLQSGVTHIIGLPCPCTLSNHTSDRLISPLVLGEKSCVVYWAPMAFQADSSRFLAWFQRCEGASISNKIELADLRGAGAGRGIGTALPPTTRSSGYGLAGISANVRAVAAADITADEDLFEIPRYIVLSVETSDFKERLPGVLDQLDPWTSLVLVMIYEDLKGDDSFWRPYFRVLPERFDTLIYWSPDELAELKGSAVVHKIGKDEADKTFSELVVPIMRRHPRLFPYPPGVSSYDGPSGERAILNMAHRMATLVMAYGFDLERDETAQSPDEDGFMSDDDEENLPKGMVPMADMLNADADRNNVSYHSLHSPSSD